MPNEQMMLEGQLPTSTPPMPTPAEAEAMMSSIPPGDMEAMVASLPPEMTSGIGSLVNAEEQAPMVPESGIGALSQITDQLAAMGREGDIYVVHASEGDTVVPMDVLNANPQLKDMLFAQIGEMGYEPERYIVGNELNSINPETGLPEFFFKKLFKGLKSIAKIALPIALAYFGPAAFAALGKTAATAASVGGAGAATGTAGALTAGGAAAAAGAGSALGTALTGGNLEEIAISGGLGALGSGLGGEAVRANTLPFTEARAAEIAAKKVAADAAAGQALTPALTNVADPTMFDRAKAFLNPIRTGGEKLVYNAATGALEPVAMGAFKAALPLGATALGTAALMGGGGYGENPDDLFGDATQEEIDAKRTYFEGYPSRLATSYNPVVPAGRSYNRSLAATGTRYARDGGLASFLPVRKMAIGGPVLSTRQLAFLTPSQQLDEINAQYAEEYNRVVRGPNATMTEQEWVNSPRFQEYEDAVIGSTRALSQAGVEAQGITTAPVTQSGLRFQMDRANDPNNIYSGSAQRIADAMANVATGGSQTPSDLLRQINTLPPPPPPPPAPLAEDEVEGFNPNNLVMGPDGFPVFTGQGNLGFSGALTNPGLQTYTAPQVPTAAAPQVPASAPAVDPFAGGYQYYEPNPARVQQLQDIQPQVSNAAGLFSQGVQEAATRRQQLQEPETAKMADGGRVYGPRREGFVPGPLGIERDIVPTDLMPGEFVMTKDAVRGVGKLSGGGFKDGIKTMYGLMKRFEGVA